MISDSYREITGYEVGTEDDFAYLENYRYGESNDLGEMVSPLAVRAGTVAANYDPQAAIAYSSLWCGQPSVGTSGGWNYTIGVLVNGHTNDAYRYPLNIKNKIYYVCCLRI